MKVHCISFFTYLGDYPHFRIVDSFGIQLKDIRFLNELNNILPQMIVVKQSL
ncbi:hypothetical protein [Virgibacillus proomii]|uniref:hypothetical protein n=1 Tax=Virgibacillus proomii TaxID=84407 RepID=UPI0015C39CDC|nr:hypothetical protein [Virgibacillus proomii]